MSKACTVKKERRRFTHRSAKSWDPLYSEKNLKIFWDFFFAGLVYTGRGFVGREGFFFGGGEFLGQESTEQRWEEGG